jgi:branched-chain amino acid transport system ATP-binding protein
LERNSYLELNNIDVHYGKLQALWDISVYVGHKEMVTLIGANGAGKSTILRVISGLHRPTKGKIFFSENRIDTKTTQSIVELGICMVPEGRKLFDDMSTFENLEMGAILSRAKKARDENLNLVYGLFPILKTRAKQLAGTLSGGEQQMLAIGRALLSDPRLLVLDEVSQGLAPLIIQNLSVMIKRINELKGLAIFFAEQNLRMALKLASRAYIIENVRLVAEGEAKALLASRYAKEAYMGVRLEKEENV